MAASAQRSRPMSAQVCTHGLLRVRLAALRLAPVPERPKACPFPATFGGAFMQGEALGFALPMATGFSAIILGRPQVLRQTVDHV